MIVRVLAVVVVLSLMACIAIVLATSAGLQVGHSSGGKVHILAPGNY